MTLREVESSTGCKLLVRGKGSMKDKKLVSFVIFQKEFQIIGKIGCDLKDDVCDFIFIHVGTLNHLINQMIGTNDL